MLFTASRKFLEANPIVKKRIVDKIDFCCGLIIWLCLTHLTFNGLDTM